MSQRKCRFHHSASGGVIINPHSAGMAVLYLSLIYMAASIINVCLLSLFPISFSVEGEIATVSGVLDFATYLGTGISAMIFGYIIESHGYNVMYMSWLVLSVFAILIIKHIQRSRFYVI